MPVSDYFVPGYAATIRYATGLDESGHHRGAIVPGSVLEAGIAPNETVPREWAIGNAEISISRSRCLRADGRRRHRGTVQRGGGPQLEKISILPIEIGDEGEAKSPARGLFSRNPRSEEISSLSEDLATLIASGVPLDR